VADLTSPGSAGFGTFRLDPTTGEVYFDPSTPGGWPVGVSTATARAVVRDSTGDIAFSALSAEVTRVASSHPLFDEALEVWRFGDQLVSATPLKGAYPATLADADGTISLTTLNGRAAVLCVGGATRARYDLGSIGPSDPLSMSASAGMTVMFRGSFDALGAGGFGRIIELSDAGGGGMNGWGVWCHEAFSALSMGVDGLNSVQPAPTSAGPDVYGVTCSWGAQPKYFRGGAEEGVGAFDAPPQPGSVTRPGALLNWNHAEDRQHEGMMEWIAVWDRVLTSTEVAIVSADPVGVLGLDA